MTCETPMGLGDPIDWEPPVLSLVPVPASPMYVRYGTTLTGTVTDNIAVDRVILRDSVTGQELFRASINDGKWHIELKFDRSRNGDQVAAEIIAYDRMGNTGAPSMKSITLIIDIQEPLIDDIYISRTEVRRAYLEKYADLAELETSDRLGEKSANVNRYQNGSFWIDAKITEDETRVLDNNLTLNLYDSRYPGVIAYSVERERKEAVPNSPSTPYSPRWLVREQDIIASGSAVFGPQYETDYNNGARYYYRVSVVAYDRSYNQSMGGPGMAIVEDKQYFVLWKNADKPKGIVDPLVATQEPVILTRGKTLPVEFFDDDVIDWGYAFLLSQDQWDGIEEINTSVKIPAGTMQQKLDWLKNKLRNGDQIYDWKFDVRDYDGTKTDGLIANVAGMNLDEKFYYVETGDRDSDMGYYMLVTLIGDRKLAPHDLSALTNYGENLKDWSGGKAIEVRVVDENAPLIVFDINGGSPEENTFPSLSNNRYFTIKGYTMRPDPMEENFVRVFRIAWIPHYKGAESGLTSEHFRKAVEAKLRDKNHDFTSNGRTGVFTGNITVNSVTYNLDGIQYWDIDTNFSPTAQAKWWTDSAQVKYRWQDFTKEFDILGGTAANKTTGIPLAGRPSTILKNDPAKAAITENHFVYNGQLENENKLFIFFAEDNMGHQVYREIRILGNKAPPQISIYDLTGSVGLEAALTGIPVVGTYITPADNGVITDSVRANYRAALKGWQWTGYTNIKNIVANLSLGTGNVMQTLRAYPRDTLVTYWAKAQALDQILLDRIELEDVTYATSVIYDNFDTAAGVLSYVERLPEVTQRTFRFRAYDTLGNEEQLQRTVTITNTAILKEITTTSQDGTYGIGKTITLRAFFSNPVKWDGASGADYIPKINVRYNLNGVNTVRSISTSTARGETTLYLDFPVPVQAGDGGQLVTMWKGITGNPSVSGNPDSYDRPILLFGTNNNHPSGQAHSNCTHIYDAERSDNAFIPGYSQSIEWDNATGSLQSQKTIIFDGIAPQYVSLAVSGGRQLTQSGQQRHYFKSNETLSFTLTANEEIQTTGGNIPRIRFQIQSWNNNGTEGTISPTLYHANYERSADSGKAMVFTVSTTGIPDGVVVNITLNTENGGIADVNGNPLTLVPTPYLSLANNFIRIDKTKPAAPTPYLEDEDRLGNGIQAVNNGQYNYNPYLRISGPSNEPFNIDYTQYSLDNGLNWVSSGTAKTDWTTYHPGTNPPLGLTVNSGTWILKTRHVDYAGNIGEESSHAISINTVFPRLASLRIINPTGYFITASSMEIRLTFAAPVYTQTAGNVTITVSNRNSPNTDTSGGANAHGTSNSYTAVIQAVTIPSGSPNSTVTFNWSSIQNKEMLDGIYISAVNFSGLCDVYGNVGESGNAAFSSAGTLTISEKGSTYNVSNINSADHKVDCIKPKLDRMTPANAEGRSSNITTTTAPYYSSSVSSDNKTITLVFNEAVQPVSGKTITVKPHGKYLIPPVFENESYYLNTANNVRSKNYIAGYTLIKGMNDIYNDSTLTTAEKGYLVKGSNLSDGITYDDRTGQTFGPYVRTTQGLKEGRGYTGAYTVTPAGGTPAVPNREESTTGSPFMIPDTSMKWVLAYAYSIDGSQNITDWHYNNSANYDASAVDRIRNVLTKVKYRWQEREAVSAEIVGDSKTWKITLSEPLEKGLKWDICFPEGTFTDLAGNEAAGMNFSGSAIATNTGASTDGTVWFWSSGVQTPVIRVNRKSYDGKTSNWRTSLTYENPSDAAAASNAIGWGIGNFNTVNYRIETETPGARISHGFINGNGQTVRTHSDNIGNGNMFMVANNTDTTAWGDIPKTSPAIAWNAGGLTSDFIAWLMPNLIRRYSGDLTGAPANYTVDGELRIFAGTHRGLRSYNKDARLSELNTATLGASFGGGSDNGVSKGQDDTTLCFTYYPTEARKDYVIAQATVDHDANGTYGGVNMESSKGYEGVFRSVIALQFSENRNHGNPNPICVEGSDTKNGMPTIAGFPVRDAQENGDRRWIKVFYRSVNSTNNSQFYWVSTEIVSQWYFLKWGGGGWSHQSSGEVNNYLTAGYGDLVYCRNIQSYGNYN